MADWPTLAEVKLSLGVTTTNKDSLIAAALDAAIEQVKTDVFGSPAEFDEELAESDSELVLTNSLSQAALILAVMVTKAPDAPYGIAAVFDAGALKVAADHPTYTRLLVGSRYDFGIG